MTNLEKKTKNKNETKLIDGFFISKSDIGFVFNDYFLYFTDIQSITL